MGDHPRASPKKAESAARTGDSDDETETDKGPYVNIRSLTRGDGAVIGAAVLLLIASFLTFYGTDGCDADACKFNAWDSNLFPLLPSVHLLAFVGAGLIVAARFQPQGRKLLGIALDQWGAVLAAAAAWDALWSLFHGGSGLKLGAGAWLSFITTAALAAVGLLSLRGLPALAIPLLGAPRPQQPYAPQPYPGGTQQGGPQQGGYGYPGAPAPDPSFSGQPQSFGGPVPAQSPNPQVQPQVQPQPAPSEFAAFWFAVPVPRPLFPEDGSPSPIAELTPGTWYLAVDQQGPALIAQIPDGRRGVLRDSTGIQRG